MIPRYQSRSSTDLGSMTSSVIEQSLGQKLGPVCALESDLMRIHSAGTASHRYLLISANILYSYYPNSSYQDTPVSIAGIIRHSVTWGQVLTQGCSRLERAFYKTCPSSKRRLWLLTWILKVHFCGHQSGITAIFGPGYTNSQSKAKGSVTVATRCLIIWNIFITGHRQLRLS